ncbi:unnamed protein product [Cylicocyclus nassatus]|uniref:Uncharacterized protein n=1 Tax=Cylicocyclus nassatus TaxID=53992 RepID=A0AA36HF86_CYLNA|nr:unnamed protein product [Cylicocyclus nassatus]
MLLLKLLFILILLLCSPPANYGCHRNWNHRLESLNGQKRNLTKHIGPKQNLLKECYLDDISSSIKALWFESSFKANILPMQRFLLSGTVHLQLSGVLRTECSETYNSSYKSSVTMLYLNLIFILLLLCAPHAYGCIPKVDETIEKTNEQVTKEKEILEKCLNDKDKCDIKLK